MQKIGRKSICTMLSVTNSENPTKPYKVIIQANKNYGICDIILGTEVVKETIDEKTKKKKFHKEFVSIRRINEVLSIFWGRQYNDYRVLNHLENILNEIL